MKLTIEHLKGYLGTGLELRIKCRSAFKNREGIVYIEKWNMSDIEQPFQKRYSTIEIKPILYPLSSLTEYREDLGFIPMEMLNNRFNLDLTDFIKAHNSTNYLPYWAVEILQQWHIDIHNLIENNLAIDKRTIQ